MLRLRLQRFLKSNAQSTYIFQARWKGSQELVRPHVVSSPTLKQLESPCNDDFEEPRHLSGKVTVIGAASDVGLIACLFLKQQGVIKTLAMYDEPPRGVIGCAHDMAHIDTSTAIEAFLGKAYLPHALDDADVVLLCGGKYPCPPCCTLMDRDLFFYNMQYVRSMATAVAHFCPHACFCVQTPPVDANYALCKFTLERYEVYDKRKLLGINTVNSMRANQLYCKLAKQDPVTSYCPVVGGTGRCTRVPVFSVMKNFVCQNKDEIACITRLVREADELICKVKGNCEQGHLSIGFATARAVVAVMNGLHGKQPSTVESALVEQAEPDKCYSGMTYCATPVTMGHNGISVYQIPVLSPDELLLLEESRANLEDMLNLGRCYALGEEYVIHPELCPPCIPLPAAELCQAVSVKKAN